MKNKVQKAVFKFSNFSLKQKMVLEWWMEGSPYKDKDGIIADGSIRSGKTTVMSLSFIIWAMDTFDGENFALCGKTIQSLRRNVVKQLKKMLQTRGYSLQECRIENSMTIRLGNVENEFYLFGGKDEGSQDLIQGITLAGLFLDEAALMPQSFVDQATGRCSVAGSKMWFNCNPKGPDHYIKKEWIDRISELNFIRIHFTMSDNPSLPEKIIRRYESMYSGVFFDRYIRGLWVLASGIIFRYFAEDNEPYLFRDSDIFNRGILKQAFSKIVMGIDFGGNGAKTTFVLSGYIGGYKEFRILEEDSLPVTEDIDAKRICDKFIEFYKAALDRYGRVDWIFPDSASTTMINSLRSAAGEAGFRSSNIKGCRKNETADRPKTIDMLFNSGRLKINERCVNIRKAIGSLVWDEKHPNLPEDKNIGNCNDWWDAFCYCFLDFIEYIDLNR